jgi:hypothetical protein
LIEAYAHRIIVCLFLALISGPIVFGADVKMQVVKSDYLSTQGFDVMLYDSTYHSVFVDQKNTAMPIKRTTGSPPTSLSRASISATHSKSQRNRAG